MEVFFYRKNIIDEEENVKVTICFIISRMKVLSVMVITMILILAMYQMYSFISIHCINHRQM